jgi:hypothetical protein
MSDLIDRQAALDIVMEELDSGTEYDIPARIKALPSAQPAIIRCKDCRWWDKYGDYDNGYCMAAKHGYWSEHWEISIRRTYKGDFYCADAERRTE